MADMKEKLTTIFSLPKEIALDLPIIMATGQNELNIENYKTLLEFTDKKIRIRIKDNIVTIDGDNLSLKQVTTENILISGRIMGITYG